uniref:Uncharacterized protein n=1 Tax=Anopheles arabiensis TaxID=7173 RepID=A0A182IFG5_ANOAR
FFSSRQAVIRNFSKFAQFLPINSRRAVSYEFSVFLWRLIYKFAVRTGIGEPALFSKQQSTSKRRRIAPSHNP